jgi:hypothetical protein
MRTFARFFSLGCGAIVIVIAARYGFKTSDNDFDGGMWAFTYGAVTLAGLFGHALGVRAWPNSKLVGALVFAVSAFALLISLSNSIGAMAGRGNVQQAERMRVADIVRDARRSLKRAEDEREGLKFTPADGAAVAAAKAKADAATLDKEAAHRDYDAAKQASDTECLIRGKVCLEKEKLTAGKDKLWHEREQAEATALAALEAVTNNKAMTDHAAKLDAGIAALREKIEKAGPVLEANSQGSALARLFGLPDTKAATLSTYQNLAMAVVIEFLIAISLVASEVIGQPEKGPAPAAAGLKAVVRKEAGNIEDEKAEPAQRIEVLPAAKLPKPSPAAPKPRLITSQSNPIGNVAQIMADILVPGRGRVEIAALYVAYSKACAAAGKRPIAAGDFPAALAALCKTLNIRIEVTDTGVYLLRVKLLATTANVSV